METELHNSADHPVKQLLYVRSLSAHTGKSSVKSVSANSEIKSEPLPKTSPVMSSKKNSDCKVGLISSPVYSSFVSAKQTNVGKQKTCQHTSEASGKKSNNVHKHRDKSKPIEHCVSDAKHSELNQFSTVRQVNCIVSTQRKSEKIVKPILTNSIGNTSQQNMPTVPSVGGNQCSETVPSKGGSSQVAVCKYPNTRSGGSSKSTSVPNSPKVGGIKKERRAVRPRSATDADTPQCPQEVSRNGSIPNTPSQRRRTVHVETTVEDCALPSSANVNASKSRPDWDSCYRRSKSNEERRSSSSSQWKSNGSINDHDYEQSRHHSCHCPVRSGHTSESELVSPAVQSYVPNKPWAVSLRDYVKTPSPVRSRKSTPDSDSQWVSNDAAISARSKERLSMIANQPGKSSVCKQDTRIKQGDKRCILGTKSDTVLQKQRLAAVKKMTPASSASFGNFDKIVVLPQTTSCQPRGNISKQSTAGKESRLKTVEKEGIIGRLGSKRETKLPANFVNRKVCSKSGLYKYSPKPDYDSNYSFHKFTALSQKSSAKLESRVPECEQRSRESPKKGSEAGSPKKGSEAGSPKKGSEAAGNPKSVKNKQLQSAKEKANSIQVDNTQDSVDRIAVVTTQSLGTPNKISLLHNILPKSDTIMSERVADSNKSVSITVSHFSQKLDDETTDKQKIRILSAISPETSVEKTNGMVASICKFDADSNDIVVVNDNSENITNAVDYPCSDFLTAVYEPGSNSKPAECLYPDNDVIFNISPSKPLQSVDFKSSVLKSSESSMSCIETTTDIHDELKFVDKCCKLIGFQQNRLISENQLSVCESPVRKFVKIPVLHFNSLSIAKLEDEFSLSSSGAYACNESLILFNDTIKTVRNVPINFRPDNKMIITKSIKQSANLVNGTGSNSVRNLDINLAQKTPETSTDAYEIQTNLSDTSSFTEEINMNSVPSRPSRNITKDFDNSSISDADNLSNKFKIVSDDSLGIRFFDNVSDIQLDNQFNSKGRRHQETKWCQNTSATSYENAQPLHFSHSDAVLLLRKDIGSVSDSPWYSCASTKTIDSFNSVPSFASLPPIVPVPATPCYVQQRRSFIRPRSADYSKRRSPELSCFRTRATSPDDSSTTSSKLDLGSPFTGWTQSKLLQRLFSYPGTVIDRRNSEVRLPRDFGNKTVMACDSERQTYGMGLNRDNEEELIVRFNRYRSLSQRGRQAYFGCYGDFCRTPPLAVFMSNEDISKDIFPLRHAASEPAHGFSSSSTALGMKQKQPETVRLRHNRKGVRPVSDTITASQASQVQRRLNSSGSKPRPFSDLGNP